jgi:hypothetical protein
MVHESFEQGALITAAGPDVAAVPGLQPLPVELADALRVVPPGDPGTEAKLVRALPVGTRRVELGPYLSGPPLRGIGPEVSFGGELAHQVLGLGNYRPGRRGKGRGRLYAQT